MKTGPAPLAGVRVLDLTSVLMGPYATQIMADMGADVIKVEAPAGDTTRWIGQALSPGMSPLFLQVNRNKRGLVLDLKDPAGRDALLRLVDGADIFIHAIRPQAVRRLGLDAATLCALNPRLIHCGLYGYGERGCHAGKPAYDDLIQGAAAIPALYMRAGGAEPRYAPTTIADRITGLTGLVHILMALYARERGGRGQAIDVPMFETMAAFVLTDHLYLGIFDPPPGPLGYARLLDPNRKPYATADGHICVMVYTDRHWQRFFEITGRTDLKDDARFATFQSRAENVDSIYRFVREALASRTTQAWLAVLDDADIPAMPMNSVDDLLTDRHLAEVGLLQWAPHPTEGALRMIGVPAEWRDFAPAVPRPAPHLGEHSVEILREVGLKDATIDAMLKTGATIDGRGAGETLSKSRKV